jgi:general secretion pathway protein F
MPTFIYKAKQGPQTLIDGSLEASNRDHAVSKILQMGLTPLDVNQSDAKTFSTGEKPLPKEQFLQENFLSSLKTRVSKRDIVWFTRQMSDMTGASVPLLRSLEIIQRQTIPPQFKKILEGVHAAVRDGGSFSDGLAKYPQAFARFYTSMVRTGEVSGELDQVLSRLADHLEKEQEMYSRIQASLAYPVFILGVGALTVFVLMTFVIPRLLVIYEDMDQVLPFSTQILIATSAVFVKFWWLMIIVAVLGFWQGGRWFKTAQGRLWKDTLFLRIPFLKDFIRNIEVGRFSRSLATLLATGVPIYMGLKTVEATIGNVILRQEISELGTRISDGSSLRIALKNTQFFPEAAVSMISVGEETGRLDQSLFKVADIFERQADQASRMMISVLGPLMLVFIVMVVGFVVVALMLPILQMNLIVE